MNSADIKLYYSGGVTYIELGNNLFFTVTDNAQRRGIASTLPKEVKETTVSADHEGRVSGQARSMIATACEVARAMKQNVAELSASGKGA